MIINLGNQDINLLFAQNDKVIVDIYATWCGPCKMLSTQLEEFAKSHKDWTIIKVDSDQNQQLASQYNVQAVPTMLIVVQGKVKETVVGYKPLVELERITDKY
ncbi:MAG: thioredoxin family protein [Mycoplasmoidaceae bacterium]